MGLQYFLYYNYRRKEDEGKRGDIFPCFWRVCRHSRKSQYRCEPLSHSSSFELIRHIQWIWIYRCEGDTAAIISFIYTPQFPKTLSYKSTMLNDLSKRIVSKDEPLTSYFPPLLWLIHDFQGDLTDEYGMPMNPDDYLEEALKNQEGFSKEVLELNKIRILYANLFAERRCFVLANLLEKDKEELAKLKEVVFESVRPKTVNEAAITGKVFIALVERIIEKLNNGSVSVLPL
eukprot:TRINITY_DN9488_c0_g7_i1.p1 TRINITY_DN9488_c0_g7~~TRINITY_DN9488_c0_g7_i1.p1  ORF type:complete len:232 (-),score=20.19 TRINITY_DN9488_c0_g7_i1:694-1389(-)